MGVRHDRRKTIKAYANRAADLAISDYGYPERDKKKIAKIYRQRAYADIKSEPKGYDRSNRYQSYKRLATASDEQFKKEAKFNAAANKYIKDKSQAASNKSKNPKTQSAIQMAIQSGQLFTRQVQNQQQMNQLNQINQMSMSQAQQAAQFVQQASMGSMMMF